MTVMMPTIGPLRHRVRVQKRVEQKNSFGEVETTSWETVIEAWADVTQLRGAEQFQAQQTKGLVDTRVIMRYRDWIVPKMRILIAGEMTPLDIESVVNLDGKDRFLEIMCKEPA